MQQFDRRIPVAKFSAIVAEPDREERERRRGEQVRQEDGIRVLPLRQALLELPTILGGGGGKTE